MEFLTLLAERSLYLLALQQAFSCIHIKQNRCGVTLIYISEE
jgi:hypothetical protein